MLPRILKIVFHVQIWWWWQRICWQWTRQSILKPRSEMIIIRGCRHDDPPLTALVVIWLGGDHHSGKSMRLYLWYLTSQTKSQAWNHLLSENYLLASTLPPLHLLQFWIFLVHKKGYWNFTQNLGSADPPSLIESVNILNVWILQTNKFNNDIPIFFTERRWPSCLCVWFGALGSKVSLVSSFQIDHQPSSAEQESTCIVQELTQISFFMREKNMKQEDSHSFAL